LNKFLPGPLREILTEGMRVQNNFPVAFPKMCHARLDAYIHLSTDQGIATKVHEQSRIKAIRAPPPEITFGPPLLSIFQNTHDYNDVTRNIIICSN